MTEEISLKIENEEIIFVESINRENVEFIVVCKNKNAYLFDYLNRKNNLIGALEFPMQYSEDYFKSIEFFGYKKDFLQAHSYNNYICITQKYGQNGVIFNLENPKFKKKFIRGDYHVEHCIFPIALYSIQNSIFLIHGTDWNRLDITNLENDELLTGRFVDYETDSNYFDYFHSSLSMSPDEKHFTSNGWVWQPYDIVTVYETEQFVSEFEMANTKIDFEPVDGYNWDRPLCWINNKTVGIGYNKKEANEGKGNFTSEIIFVDILENKIIQRIEFDGFAFSEYGGVEGDLFFDSSSNHFIGLNKQNGLLISDINGKKSIKIQI